MIYDKLKFNNIYMNFFCVLKLLQSTPSHISQNTGVMWNIVWGKWWRI